MLKEKFLDQSAFNIRRKLQKLIQEASFLKQVVNHSQYSLLQPRTGEKGQGSSEGKRKVRPAQISATLAGQPYPTSFSRSTTKDTKYFICQETGHWNKECPNNDKPPQEPCHRCKKTGHWAALYPSGQRAPGPKFPTALQIATQDWNWLPQLLHLR